MYICRDNSGRNHKDKGFLTNDTPRINLSTSEDIRREMSKVYRETRNLKIATTDATKLVFILSQILKAYESEVIEKQLINIENKTLQRR